MPKLRYERDRSSPSPIIHDKEIRAVLIVAERGTGYTVLSMQVHASRLTPWKRWVFSLTFCSLELCCVLWDSIMTLEETQGEIPFSKHN